MWFEILPSFAIITVVLSVPGFALYGLNMLAKGKPYRRSTDYPWNRYLYARDSILGNGDPYVLNGLESVKD